MIFFPISSTDPQKEVTPIFLHKEVLIAVQQESSFFLFFFLNFTIEVDHQKKQRTAGEKRKAARKSVDQPLSWCHFQKLVEVRKIKVNKQNKKCAFNHHFHLLPLASYNPKERQIEQAQGV